MSNQQISFWLYRIGLLAITTGMPLGKFLITAGVFVLALAWLTEGNFKQKFHRFGKEKILWIIAAFILLHFLGLAWSDDFSYGLKDIKTKLPLFFIPFILITATAIDWKERWQEISWTFIAAVLVLTIVSTGIHFGIFPSKKNLDDVRNIIPTVSHVRLSLFICFSIAILVYRFLHYRNNWKFTLLLPVVWFLYFLNLIESATGIVILLAVLFLGILFYTFRLHSVLQKALIVSVMLLMIAIPMYWMNAHIQNYYEVKEKVDLSRLPVYSKYGEKYLHDLNNPMVENGNYVWIFIAYRELEATWNKRSEIPFDGMDKKHQPLKYTLIRYLASKGLRRDQEGLNSLSKNDIENIENGIANFEYTKTSGLERRIQQLIFEWESFRHGSLAFGNSLTQRLVFWKFGWRIFHSSFWFGVGTGDVQKAFDEQYKNLPYQPGKKYTLRAHNQYLTMALTFGVTGFILFIIYAFSLPLFLGRQIYFLTAAFVLISLISFISEDTLETQAGATFIAFFQGVLYVLNRNRLYID